MTAPSTTLSDLSAAGTARVRQGPEKPQFPLYSWKQKSPNARLMYTRDVEEAEAELAKLPAGPIGFDLEWKPTYVSGHPENPVALVQIGNDEVILLVQVSAMREFPEKLRDVLGNPSYLKAGVGIRKDCEKLYRDFSVVTRGCVDLSLLARTVDNDRWKGGYSINIGLARLCETYEELSLDKGKTTRSNWERYLSEVQQEYAANDCHSGYSLCCKLQVMAAAMSPVPMLTWYAFDYIGRFLDPETGMAWWPHNPNYDPGPPPPPKPPADGASEKPARANGRKKIRRQARDDYPHASNVAIAPEPSDQSNYNGYPGGSRSSRSRPPYLSSAGPSRGFAARGRATGSAGVGSTRAYWSSDSPSNPEGYPRGRGTRRGNAHATEDGRLRQRY